MSVQRNNQSCPKSLSSPLNPSNLSVRIQLDNPPPFYTSLDVISGHVILSLTSDETISAITVKLEGESKTVLARPPGGQQNLNPSLVTQLDNRQGLAKEEHKLLYKIIQVFPSQDPGSSMNTKVSYMLRSGQHEYPFRFKIPLNNVCWDPEFQVMRPEGFKGFYGQVPHCTHVERTLPPSLTGFPGEAEIRYFVKVTVQRPSMKTGDANLGSSSCLLSRLGPRLLHIRFMHVGPICSRMSLLRCWTLCREERWMLACLVKRFRPAISLFRYGLLCGI